MNELSDIDQSHDVLPEPDDEAKQHSLVLCAQIEKLCQGGDGVIPFSEFMQQALYAPGLGYYSGGLQKFGEAGDFTTAPEVSPLFAQCLARQVADVLNDTRCEDAEPCILELGAGSGVMAADMLLELEQLDALPGSYMILELSAELRQRQQSCIKQKVPHLLERVSWLDELPSDLFNGVIVANEVLDAMPAECFKIAQDGVESLMIGFDNEALVSTYKKADAEIVDKVRTIEERLKETREEKLPKGYCSEFNPSIKPWLDTLYSVLNRGMVLLIDYGYPGHEYYHEERRTGTMMCHYRQRAHTNPLWYPGLQDITAFVDFTDVAYCAAEAGFDIRGYTTQAAFLMGCGLAELHESLVTDDVKNQIMLSQQIKTLTLPSEMGERFKAMVLTKNYDEPLRGFEMQDMRGRL
jgi:SAM-dependent MidA family methyltransferase